LRDFVAQVGIPSDDFYFADGSGLSRKALVAPEAVIKLLEHMALSPHFNAYYDSLPMAGIDGTLDQRFMGTPAVGAIHAKTGTITHVNSLSGYMDLPSGERLAFSIFGNLNPASARQGAHTADQIALAIFEQYGGRKKISQKKPTRKETFKSTGH
jgi:D-alanyl-D-alanine carboxypeptidase/D-alanyl-D-alanine-endopeptidase (penicillin-binding protein 4)